MSKKKLFIVEDNATFAEILKDYIERKPLWEVEVFNSGEACIERAFEDPYAVIIDYHLDSVNSKALNGIQTLTQLKKISPNAHCIFLSSQEKYGLALQTLQYGAEKYIIKNDDAFEEIAKALEETL